jgi:hypothetical protein
MTPVTQPWTHEITMMQQTVLLAAIRGPDGVAKYHPVKFMLRWYRRCVLYSAMDHRVIESPFAEGGGSFTGKSYDVDIHGQPDRPDFTNDGWMDYLVGQYLRSLDEIPHHFQIHFMHAVEILGYKHPDDRIRTWWAKTYVRLVSDLHLWPETEEQLDHRLGDDRDQWLERNDPATVQ